MDDPVLKYDSVEISYNSKAVIHNVSVSLHKGEILGIVGKSGSGKSTLIKAAMGLLGKNGMVSKGGIWFNGKNITGLNEKEFRKIRGAKIGMIFQDAGASFCPVRKIGAQIVESAAAHVKITKAVTKEKTLTLFEALDLKDGPRIWDSYPFKLSGGMNQRIAIASAMLMKPDILLADEPTSALDVLSQKQVIREILRLRELFETAVILVTHDISAAAHMADSLLILKDGTIQEYGDAHHVLYNPQSSYTRSLLEMSPKLRRK